MNEGLLWPRVRKTKGPRASLRIPPICTHVPQPLKLSATKHKARLIHPAEGNHAPRCFPRLCDSERSVDSAVGVILTKARLPRHNDSIWLAGASHDLCGAESQRRIKKQTNVFVRRNLAADPAYSRTTGGITLLFFVPTRHCQYVR